MPKGKPRTPKPITRSTAMRYMCWTCSGEYEDGMVDCKAYSCPLYYFMPYGDKSKANLDFLKYNPKRKGKLLKKN